MALTSMQKMMNESILRDIVDQKFQAVTNKQVLLTKLLSLLEAHEICLHTYTGLFRNFILQSIAASIKNNLFDEGLAEASVRQAAREIRSLEAKERATYIQQAPERNITSQLSANGYVEVAHLLTNTDINQFLNIHLKSNSNVELCAPISITQDNGQALSGIFSQHKTSAKLLIVPVNVGNNHWILLYGQPNKGAFTLWDPMASNRTNLKNIVQSAANEAYQEPVQVSAVNAAEQKDGVSCGQRISQKALKVAGIKNEFTEISASNPSLLTYHIVQDLVAATPELAGQPVAMINDETAPLIYIGSDDKPAIREVIANKRMIQENSDELLAVALQDIYNQNSNFSEEAAMDAARKMLNTSTYKELEAKKLKLASWMENYQSKLNAPFFNGKSCKEVAEPKKDREASTPTLAS